jgi:Leu/Phe-tRNA-protein transferase
MEEEDVFSQSKPWTCTTCTVVNPPDESACNVCGEQSHMLHVSLPQLAAICRQCDYGYVASWNDLEHLPRASSREFCLTPTFHPRLIQRAVGLGCFPMTTYLGPRGDGIHVMAIKLHRERCVVDLRLHSPHVKRKTRKQARGLWCTLNKDENCFDRARDMLQRRHHNNWMAPMLAQSLKCILRAKPDDMRVLVWELWSEKDALVAVEIGYAAGKIYTSMTGAFDPAHSGAGSVQLAVTGAWLVQNGFFIWDFGMQMEYKQDIGAHAVPRARWLEMVVACGGGPPIETVPKAGGDKWSCDEYLKHAVPPPRPELLATMSVRELKDLAKTLEVPLIGVSEKQEIVELLRQRYADKTPE